MTHSIIKPKSRPTITFDLDSSMTEQSHKKSCDIHNIMQQFQAHGVISHVNRYKGAYMDMTSAPDFQEAQNIVATAMSMFETVPATIRDQFGNDPAAFLDFMQNPANINDIEALGLDASHLPPKSDFSDPAHTPRAAENAPEPPPEPSPDASQGDT